VGKAVVEVAGFVVLDSSFDARGVMQLREVNGMRLYCILEVDRSAIIADKDPIPVCWVVQDAGGFYGVHNHYQVLVASSDEYVDVGHIVTVQVSFLSNRRFDSDDPEEVWDCVWYCVVTFTSQCLETIDSHVHAIQNILTQDYDLKAKEDPRECHSAQSVV
jgi:hypothetical protein